MYGFLNIFALSQRRELLTDWNMKQFIHIAAFAAAIVFSGCEPVDLTDHGRAPESIGPVTVNRERIGTGQPFPPTDITSLRWNICGVFVRLRSR